RIQLARERPNQNFGRDRHIKRGYLPLVTGRAALAFGHKATPAVNESVRRRIIAVWTPAPTGGRSNTLYARGRPLYGHAHLRARSWAQQSPSPARRCAVTRTT